LKTVKDLIKKIEKFYEKGDIFRAYIEQKDIFPIEIKLQKVTQKQIQSNFSEILKRNRELKEANLPLIYKEVNFKNIGRQLLPISVCFKSLEEYLKFIKKEYEYQEFVALFDYLVSLYPSFKEIFLKKPFLVLEQKKNWQKLLNVVTFFVKNTNPKLYIRELSIDSVDTKFIEKYKKLIDLLLCAIFQKEPLKGFANFAFEKRYCLKYPKPQIRFRILDKALYIQGLNDLELPLDAFKNLQIACKRVYIIENKITFLSFFDIKDAIVIFGSGYKLSLLKKIEWLKTKEIYYWSDIDEDGFAMLSQLRSYFPQTKSILMDSKTIESYKHLSVFHNNKTSFKELTNLTQNEQLIYNRLQNDFYGANFRLEQERIPFSYVKNALST